MVMVCLSTTAQKLVEVRKPIDVSTNLELEFKFADDIVFHSWDKNEVLVKASVNINNNKDNDEFEFISDKNSGKLINEQPRGRAPRYQKSVSCPSYTFLYSFCFPCDSTYLRITSSFAYCPTVLA